jgi:hypothetical protein
VVVLVACGNEIGGTGQCGGAPETDVCVRIESITPVYLTVETSNVDVWRQVECRQDVPDGSGNRVMVGIEPFPDHEATLVVSSTRLPGAPPAFAGDVTLRDYSISYTLNRCPVGATCPALSSLAAEQTTLLPAGQSITLTLPFAPLALRHEYLDQGGGTGDYSSYTAEYTLTGTNSFNEKVSVQGSAEFTIGDFNHCPTGSS